MEFHSLFAQQTLRYFESRVLIERYKLKNLATSSLASAAMCAPLADRS